MSLRSLDHVNVRTSRLAAMKTFYQDVLGMTVGPRPAFSFGGAWLYCGGRAVVHLVEVASQPTPGPSLQLEHFAFAGDDLDVFRARLEAAGVTHRIETVADFGLRQVHLHDPDGNHIHVDFGIRSAQPGPSSG
jgi:catechol 2,3-dioxygenase-like lactoylglutathione lyase family enzyme